MFRLPCRRPLPSSRRLQVHSHYLIFPRRSQSTKTKSHPPRHQYTPPNHPRYPFPTHPNPTSSQIFHLPTNAPPEVIKARYYELAKIYHPDVVGAYILPSGEQGGTPTTSSEGLTPEIAQARFQAVTKAYDSLRKGKAKGRAHLGANLFAGATESRMSARRKRELRARAELRVGDDEKWRERLIVGALVATMIAFVYQTLETRREGLAIAAAANSRANQKRKPLKETLVSYPPPKDPTTGIRSKQTIEDENLLAAQDS